MNEPEKKKNRRAFLTRNEVIALMEDFPDGSMFLGVKFVVKKPKSVATQSFGNLKLPPKDAEFVHLPDVPVMDRSAAIDGKPF